MTEPKAITLEQHLADGLEAWLIRNMAERTLHHDVVVSTKTGKKIDQTFAISDLFKVVDAECPEATALMFKAGASAYVQWPQEDAHAELS